MNPFEPWPEDLTFPEPSMPPFPASISFFEPLEMFLPVAMLQEATKTNLSQLESYMADVGELDVERQALLDTARIQRLKFLAWLEQVPNEHTYIALYPTREDILQENE